MINELIRTSFDEFKGCIENNQDAKIDLTEVRKYVTDNDIDEYKFVDAINQKLTQYYNAHIEELSNINQALLRVEINYKFAINDRHVNPEWRDAVMSNLDRLTKRKTLYQKILRDLEPAVSSQLTDTELIYYSMEHAK